MLSQYMQETTYSCPARIIDQDLLRKVKTITNAGVADCEIHLASKDDQKEHFRLGR